MSANLNRKGTPRRGTPRSAAPRQSLGAPAPKAPLSAPRGAKPSMPRTQAGKPSRAPSLGSRKPAAPLSATTGRAPARKPAAPRAKAKAAPRAKARPQAGRPARSARKAATEGSGLALGKRAKGSPKLELKNPFAGIGGKKPAATPSAVAAAGPVQSFIEGGAPAPASGREARERHQRAGAVKVLGLAAAAVCVLGVVALIAFFALRDSSVFSVENVEVEASAHVSQADVSKLLTVPEGTTLLNVDSSDIEAQLKRDPWVQSVKLTREFPHTLKVSVQEQSADLLVVMASGSIGWYLGSGGSWIEPVKISVPEGQSVNDAALKKARSEGVTLVTGVPATVDPSAGSAATDDVLAAVQAFRSGFSADFSSKIVSYDASSADAVSCVLESGVRVLLGSATNISYKEEIASALLSKYPGKVTYINVRTPSSPSVRRVGSDDVTQGSGADGADDDGSSADSATSGSSSGALDVSSPDYGSAAGVGSASDVSGSDGSASGVSSAAADAADTVDASLL